MVLDHFHNHTISINHGLVTVDDRIVIHVLDSIVERLGQLLRFFGSLEQRERMNLLAGCDLYPRKRRDSVRTAHLKVCPKIPGRVVVGEREGGVAELLGPEEEFFGVGGAVQEGEAGVAVEFDVGREIGRRHIRFPFGCGYRI